MATAGGADTTFYDDLDGQLVTGEAVALDLRPTSYVLAAAGAIIDFVLYVGVGGFLLTLALITILSGPLGADDASARAILLSGVILVLVVIPVAVEVLTRGKSLGRLAVGARIVRDDGGSIGFRHAFIRGLVAVFEFYLTFGGGAALVGLLNGKSKRLGDIVAGTYSRYERVSRDIPPVYGVPVELVEWAKTADVARIPDRLGRRMSQFLRQASRLTPFARDRISRQLASEAAAWVSPVPTVVPELFIAAVIAVRRDREFMALALEKQRLEPVERSLRARPRDFPER